MSARLADGMRDLIREAGFEASSASVGGMFGIFFAAEAPTSYEAAKLADVPRFNRFFHALLGEGVYLAPSAFEAGFTSAAHTEADLDAVFEATRKVLRTLE
jgi:glutamate-1-semialdehyde 2,1-aminomutase